MGPALYCSPSDVFLHAVRLTLNPWPAAITMSPARLILKRKQQIIANLANEEKRDRWEDEASDGLGVSADETRTSSRAWLTLQFRNRRIRGPELVAISHVHARQNCHAHGACAHMPQPLMPQPLLRPWWNRIGRRGTWLGDLKNK